MPVITALDMGKQKRQMFRVIFRYMFRFEISLGSMRPCLRKEKRIHMFSEIINCNSGKWECADCSLVLYMISPFVS